ncbi:hypothetical protein ABGB17_34010 [Sphaerisporangium sp. B11E5]|uniref:hypothetical protein n=1 Tax=Sphaerisporangium sp. B11E5 TaxID=3153563 RepID=UPI00325F6121
MTVHAAHAAALAAAAAPAAPYGPGLLGFIVVAAIGVALYFLIKSMNKQMSKIEVPRENEPERAGPETRPDGPR